jgi:hypothetical protein
MSLDCSPANPCEVALERLLLVIAVNAVAGVLVCVWA